MTQTFSKSRQKAEAAFHQAQSQFFARDQAVEEQDFLTMARESKTARLREARMAKESDDRSRLTAALTRKRAKSG